MFRVCIMHKSVLAGSGFLKESTSSGLELATCSAVVQYAYSCGVEWQ